nr:hypothetical protein [Tanacetum cinerariifolium]
AKAIPFDELIRLNRF